MKRLYDAAAAMRGMLLCEKSNHRNVTAARKMDPIVRSALAETIAEENCQADLREIEIELAQAVENLHEIVKKEQFLGLRSRQYRKALDAKARELHEERGKLSVRGGGDDDREDGDEEEAALSKQLLADWESRMEQWEKDEDALQSIHDSHKQILAVCEQMRRTIGELEKRKAVLNRLNDQCQDFLAVATAAKEPSNLDLVVTTSMEEGSGIASEKEVTALDSFDEEAVEPTHDLPSRCNEEESGQADSETVALCDLNREDSFDRHCTQNVGDEKVDGGDDQSYKVENLRSALLN